MRYCNDVTSICSLNSQKLPGHFSYGLGTRPGYILVVAAKVGEVIVTPVSSVLTAVESIVVDGPSAL